MAKKYSDFSLSFNPHPATGDVSMVSNENAITQSLRNLILTNTGEVPFIKNLGGDVRKSLFELASPATSSVAREKIKNVIENFEPRVELVDISVINDLNNNRMLITLVYSAKTSTENITAKFYIDRIV